MDAGGGNYDATQTRITVSFPDTDPSAIQADNYLATGMFVTGMGSEDQIDYGFYTRLVLVNDGNLYFDVGVFKFCEALPPLFPCGLLPWSEILYNATWEIVGASPSTPITLTARWDVPLGLIYWDLLISEFNWTFTTPPFDIVAVAPTINPSFKVGTVDLWQHCPICLWALPYMLTYNFQFGVTSKYNIGQGGWNVKLEYPRYYKDDIWYNVGKAKSIGGANAYLDARWMWFGENYEGVNAYYYENDASLGRYKIIFYYSGSTLSDHTLLWESPPPGGGCPYVSVWNGTQYVIDNNLLPFSEAGNGTDVEDYYRLEQSLVPEDGKYSLLISEFEQEHSYIDQVKLLAVDHDSDVNIAVTPDGEILTYKNPVAPLSVVDNNGTNRLGEISFMDGNVSESATYFYGEAGDYLILNFGQVNSDIAKLILRDDMKCDVCSIKVQVIDISGEWQTVAVVSPRAYWSIEAVDLSAYVVVGQDFMVRLFWTSDHRLDYVGLDTTKQDDYELHEANLVSATHSTQGNVKQELSENDNIYAELIPGQQIELAFTLPQNTKETRTYILCTKGHYYTIQT